MKINCVAIDDEPLALEVIADYISKIPFLNLLAKFDKAIEGLEYLNNNRVDLLFLDIQMDDLTGIQLLKTLKHKPNVIFTTAYEKFALMSYDMEAVDYLLKPISFERFIIAVNKVKEKLEQEGSADSSKSDAYFFVKADCRLKKINFSDILYIEGMGDYLCIVTKDEKIMTLLNFKAMENTLPEDSFARVHKSFIASINHIDYIEKGLIKIGDRKLPISESYKKQFFLLLENRSL
jgi:DNA-binding LytR/AlgR family response regulator